MLADQGASMIVKVIKYPMCLNQNDRVQCSNIDSFVSLSMYLFTNMKEQSNRYKANIKWCRILIWMWVKRDEWASKKSEMYEKAKYYPQEKMSDQCERFISCLIANIHSNNITIFK